MDHPFFLEAPHKLGRFRALGISTHVVQIFQSSIVLAVDSHDVYQIGQAVQL